MTVTEMSLKEKSNSGTLWILLVHTVSTYCAVQAVTDCASLPSYFPHTQVGWWWSLPCPDVLGSGASPFSPDLLDQNDPCTRSGEQPRQQNHEANTTVTFLGRWLWFNHSRYWTFCVFKVASWIATCIAQGFSINFLRWNGFLIHTVCFERGKGKGKGEQN